MKKNVLMVILFLAANLNIFAQDKYISKTGHIWFYSHTPMEDIEAHNRQVATILDTKTGDVVFSVLMKSFEFKRALMEEHFNENYVESDKFPKAQFKGKITNLSEVNFAKEGSYNTTIEGDMTIHGKTRKVTAKGTLEVKGGKIMANSKFNIVPQDYDIVIPSLVKDKFAESMATTVEITYEPMKK
jgi:hypothetical protein